MYCNNIHANLTVVESKIRLRYIIYKCHYYNMAVLQYYPSDKNVISFLYVTKNNNIAITTLRLGHSCHIIMIIILELELNKVDTAFNIIISGVRSKGQTIDIKT